MSMAYTIKRYVGFVSLVVFLLILSTEARAALYGFEAISDNSGVSGSLAAQLSIGVTPYSTTPGDNQVLFTFYNDGPSGEIYDVPSPIDSSFKSMHFDDGALLGIAYVLDANFDATAYPGVYFDQGGINGGNFPEGENLDPDFETSAGFWAVKDGSASNGVEPGESVGILFNIQDGFNFDSIIDAIELGFTQPLDPSDPLDPWFSDSLRIGIHVISIGEESDSFIMTPEPASLLLGSIGIGMVIARCRKRKTLIES